MKKDTEEVRKKKTCPKKICFQCGWQTCSADIEFGDSRFFVCFIEENVLKNLCEIKYFQFIISLSGFTFKTNNFSHFS